MPKKTDRKVPLSEDQRKFHKEWSREDCIAHLVAMAKAHPDQVITRNFFRVNSEISESTWNRYYGTFLEFKRQAGIVLSRHAHTLERSIAKHASKDEMRRMTAEKSSYEGKYLNPNKSRFKTAVIGSDMHDLFCDAFYRFMFIEAIKRIQPDTVVLAGDIFDMTEFGKYVQDPREYKPLERIKWVHDLLEDIRAAAPNTQIELVEGNHEFRLLRHMTEATPALVTVLADLHGLTIPKILGLDKYEVNYTARMDLAAFTERDIRGELHKNHLILWDALLIHHFPEGRNMGMPGVNGHHHKHQVWPGYNPMYGSFEWHQMGCGHIRKASYCSGEQWANGFAIAHVDTHSKSTVFEYIDVRGFALLGGKFYGRAECAPLSVPKAK